MTDRIEAIPFQRPAPELFELIQWLEDAHRDLDRVCAVEIQHEILSGFGELNPSPDRPIANPGCVVTLPRILRNTDVPWRVKPRYRYNERHCAWVRTPETYGGWPLYLVTRHSTQYVRAGMPVRLS
jgi:hypothetical protein